HDQARGGLGCARAAAVRGARGARGRTRPALGVVLVGAAGERARGRRHRDGGRRRRDRHSVSPARADHREGVVTYVVCIGAATQDTIFRVARHPEPDDLVAASDLVVAAGAPAATPLATLARRGSPAAVSGAAGT